MLTLKLAVTLRAWNEPRLESRHWERRELCVLCHPIISLMSRPQEGGRGEAARRIQKDVQKKTKAGLGEREQLQDFFASSPVLILLPNTAESNWTKTVI